MRPHPYALMLPPLTDEEYAALKVDIEANGILYPVIVDEGDLILDGVHRVRIADELGIEPPVSQMGQLDDERKLHLAVGLNMRRRHLDADRRRELVRRLHEERGLSVRQLADVTGWSKSTMARDLETSPFETVVCEATDAAEQVRETVSETPEHASFRDAVADVLEGFGGLHRFADGEWKRGEWPPDPVIHWHMTITFYRVAMALGPLSEIVEAKDKAEHSGIRDRWAKRQELLDQIVELWEEKDPDERMAWAMRLQRKNLLRPRVPSGTPEVEERSSKWN